MDKFAAMRVFVRIADAGNLSAAGRQLGLSLTSVSRQLIALEKFLGTTLVERTTRHLSLTESGLLYYERAKQILEEVAEAERGLTAQRGIASGRLHVSAPSLLGRLRLAPMLPGYLAEQTQVSIDLMLVDRPVRLADEGIDVALRIGPLEDSDLIVRKLDDVQLVVCAAPEYLRRRGEPATPDDLVEHDCLAFGDVPGVAEWSFQDGAVRRSLHIPTRLCANDFDTLVSAALAGAGLVRVPSWQVTHFLADRRLRIVLEAYQRPSTPLSILTLRNRLLLPKVRAFVDFLQQHWMHPRPPL
ncbi:LysR family transcriptional regulator [Bradyrhizobium erythrophlei]|jgi:DNA-binding transcriptional LysR family regulator|uniref:Transcriptional regulator, LysR family n=1 Tax=Bradyrhizobium erythrophlei TaxID=1437360 RepID=A0A1M5KZ30_9BRAD|nr:LysR family transcriptional regulator [Bradyrhizobium erythrophlei]SHG58084.1 transcriptional regulator, LysR family [Bradyrhizobium erythrophlei]